MKGITQKFDLMLVFSSITTPISFEIHESVPTIIAGKIPVKEHNVISTSI